MFTGIVKGVSPVTHLKRSKNFLQYAVALPAELLPGLEIGASVSIDGVCQTVVKIDRNDIYFDAIEETLNKTTLSQLEMNQKVNVERALKMGDEIGGHLLSGHIYGTAEITSLHRDENHCTLTLHCPKEWMQYILPKGFIGLSGASLTIGETDPAGYFTVHLIPETLRLTHFAHLKEGDRLNVEIDSQTKTIVDTIATLISTKK